ncbi:MAG: hypothetical protein U0228_03070 [Myxococcaceae bacterium]
MRSLLLAVVVLASLGCPADDTQYVEPPATPLDLTLFPTVGGNSKLFADVGDARLEFDPTTKDAISALGLCVDAVSWCYAPGSKELAWCLEHTRTCASAEPWNEKPCCPQQCKDDFTAAVAGGLTPANALEDVFFTKHTCFPGVTAALEVSP